MAFPANAVAELNLTRRSVIAIVLLRRPSFASTRLSVGIPFSNFVEDEIRPSIPYDAASLI
jgi:hypothetical protein